MQLKQKALKEYKAKQYNKARKSFKHLLPKYRLEQKLQKKGTTAWHKWSLGKGNLRYYLGQIALATGARAEACGHLGKFLGHLKTVPKTWTSWPKAKRLQHKVLLAKNQYKKLCIVQVRTLRLIGQPHQITAEVRGPEGWRRVTLQAGKKAGVWLLRTKRKKIVLRLRAKGFQTREWPSQKVKQGTTITYQLAPKSKPPQTSGGLLKKWWFWPAVGVTLAITTVVVVGVVVSNQPPPVESLTAADGKGPIVLWKTP